MRYVACLALLSLSLLTSCGCCQVRSGGGCCPGGKCRICKNVNQIDQSRLQSVREG